MNYQREIRSSISGDSGSPTELVKPDENSKILLTGILICNTTGTDRTASVYIASHAKPGFSARSNVFLAKDVAIPANTTVEMIEGEYPLIRQRKAHYHDKLVGYASAASAIDIIISYKTEID
tara:strand:+ start:209 stop:574 length:366 start_codon:yes stop_codon:yes gene_type:complete